MQKNKSLNLALDMWCPPCVYACLVESHTTVKEGQSERCEIGYDTQVIAVLGCLTQDTARYVCMYMRLHARALPKALEVNVRSRT